MSHERFGKYDNLCVCHTIRRARLYEQVEDDERARLKRLKEQGKIECTTEPLPVSWQKRFRTKPIDPDEWYRAAFGQTERELLLTREILSKHYKSLWKRPWAFRKRRKIMEVYIKLDGQLTVASGLSTSWF